jgi:hypothetical protein
MKKGFFFASAAVMTVTAVSLFSGCQAAKDAAGAACGDCGTVAMGDVGISGNAKLDGFFKAVADLNNANVVINADFMANVADLETAFDINTDTSLEIGARVTALVAKIKGQVTANVSGGIKVDYVPPQCSANLSVAVNAQATCEAKAKCDVQVDPGSVSVTCDGSCTGSCSGGCSGNATCKVTAPSVTCSGSCEGKCEVNVTAECTGVCKGDCSGDCSVKDAAGKCNGTCSGNCSGTCQTNVQGSCSGTCTGSCTATGASADCKGEVKCDGSCTGSCSGGCQGSATPPKASGSCSASADCQAQASAQASANLECTPPQLSLGYELTASAAADATASAKFEAQLETLKVKGAAILAGFVKYQALVTGKVDGTVVFKTAPLDSIKGGIQGVVDAGVDGKLFADIPAGRIPCVLPAMSDSISMLGTVVTKSAGTLKAQGDFAAAFKGGFK